MRARLHEMCRKVEIQAKDYRERSPVVTTGSIDNRQTSIDIVPWNDSTSILRTLPISAAVPQSRRCSCCARIRRTVRRENNTFAVDFSVCSVTQKDFLAVSICVIARDARYTHYGSDFESGLLLYGILRHEFPKTYADRLSFVMRTAATASRESYPRVSTDKAWKREVWVPLLWPVSLPLMAEKSPDDSLDFFHASSVRGGTPIPIRRFPGCVYSEMKMWSRAVLQRLHDEDYGHRNRPVFANTSIRRTSLASRNHCRARQRPRGTPTLNRRAFAFETREVKPVAGQLPEICPPALTNFPR